METLEKTTSTQNRLKIGGMTCASCVAGVERAIGKVDGSSDVSVNLATEEASFSGNVNIENVIAAIEDAGYEAFPVSDASQNDEKASHSSFKTRFFIALPLAFMVMIMDMGPMFIESWHNLIHPHIFWWNSAMSLLTAFILFFAGRSFFTGAWKSLKRRSADMNTLVAVGTGAAFLFSGYATFFGVEDGIVTPMDLYFDTAAVIIALILLGKWMEERAKNKSRDAISGLLELTPLQAHRITQDGTIETISLSKVEESDELLVKAFEQVPVDGEILEGPVSIDESMMTGESVPAEKSTGDHVTGGTRNMNASFTMKATRVGRETALARLIETVRKAQGSKPPIQRLVDKVAAVFVPIVIGIALLTLTGWLLFDGDPTKAIVNMVAVLIIACPCALGLATPTGIMVGSGRAAEKGILIKDAVTLEQAKTIDIMILDKTGTLTTGEMNVTAIFPENLSETEFLRLVAAVEQHSDHPIARAIVRHAKNEHLQLPSSTHVETKAGTGISGRVENVKVEIGAVSLLNKTTVDQQKIIEQEQQKGRTLLSVFFDDTFAGFLSLSDLLRDESVDFVKQLKELSITPVMVSGDQERTVRYMAQQLSIDEIRFEVKPDEKAAIVKMYQDQGKHVAMVGDGINDAAALVQADLGIALSSGTDLAVSSSDITILSDDLMRVIEAITLSRSTLRVIKQNLFWAFIYNTIGIPLAAAGVLSPMFAAAAMALSSVSVVSNSLRIKRF